MYTSGEADLFDGGFGAHQPDDADARADEEDQPMRLRLRMRSKSILKVHVIIDIPYCASHLLEVGPSVFIMFLFESAILMCSIMSSSALYSFHTRRRWDYQRTSAPDYRPPRS